MTSTAPDQTHLSRIARARAVRRGLLTLLTVFVALGLAGVFGVKTRAVSATSEGYRITVEYPSVTRPAIAARWRVTIVKPEGFTGPIRIVSDGRYFQIFDHNSLDPSPDRALTTGNDLVWEFDRPEGTSTTVTLDTRIEPAVQSGRLGKTALVIDGRLIVAVTYRTRVMP